jgi:hypothetical protein
MWRRLHIRIVLSRMGCFANPHQDMLSTDSCIILLATATANAVVGAASITNTQAFRVQMVLLAR